MADEKETPKVEVKKRGRKSFKNAKERYRGTAPGRLAAALTAIESIENMARNSAPADSELGYNFGENSVAFMVTQLRDSVNKLHKTFETALANPNTKVVKSTTIELPEDE